MHISTSDSFSSILPNDLKLKLKQYMVVEVYTNRELPSYCFKVVN